MAEVTSKKKWYLRWWAITLYIIAILGFIGSLSNDKSASNNEVAQQPIIENNQVESGNTNTVPTPAPIAPVPTNKEVTSEPTPTATAPKPISTPVTTRPTDRAGMLAILKANASTKWGEDYRMVQYEYNNQVEAYDWVVAQTKYPEIMSAAQQKWSNDYRMVKYEYENQVEAYEWIIAQTEYPEIMVKAKAKWGTDYRMVKYEYENQVEAYKGL